MTPEEQRADVRDSTIIVILCVIGVAAAMVGIYYFYVNLLWVIGKVIGFILAAIFGNFVEAFQALTNH